MLAKLIEWLKDIPPEIQGFIMAFFISILRTVYDGKETRPVRLFLEALICGGLSLCASSILEWAKMPNSMSVAIGGAIGFIGVMNIRLFILRYLHNRNKE